MGTGISVYLFNLETGTQKHTHTPLLGLGILMDFSSILALIPQTLTHFSYSPTHFLPVSTVISQLKGKKP